VIRNCCFCCTVFQISWKSGPLSGESLPPDDPALSSWSHRTGELPPSGERSVKAQSGANRHKRPSGAGGCLRPKRRTPGRVNAAAEARRFLPGCSRQIPTRRPERLRRTAANPRKRGGTYRVDYGAPILTAATAASESITKMNENQKRTLQTLQQDSLPNEGKKLRSVVEDSLLEENN